MAKARKDRERLWAHDPQNQMLSMIDSALAGPLARKPSGEKSTSQRGAEFEDRCAEYFRALGYKVVKTQATRDGGFDLLLSKRGRDYPVECKSHAKAVGVAPVRALLGVMQDMGVERGFVCSENGFTAGACYLARAQGITLVGGSEIHAVVDPA